MLKSRQLVIFSIVICFISVATLAFSTLNFIQAKSELIDSIDAIPKNFEVLQSVQQPTTNEQITIARRKIQRASHNIRNLKGLILSHANNAQRAQARRSLQEANQYLLDIADNSRKVADSHAELESQFMEIVELYNRKIEEVYRTQSKVKESGYGMTLWISLVGLIGSISTIMLAWRKDYREMKKLKIQINELKEENSKIILP